MAIVVLVLWMFTAAAGFRLLLTSSLVRARPAGPPAGSPQPDPGSQPAAVNRTAGTDSRSEGSVQAGAAGQAGNQTSQGLETATANPSTVGLPGAGTSQSSNASSAASTAAYPA